MRDGLLSAGCSLEHTGKSSQFSLVVWLLASMHGSLPCLGSLIQIRTDKGGNVSTSWV